MTTHEHFIQTHDLLGRYIDFMPLCTTRAQVLKLSLEIARLQEYLSVISGMTIDNLHRVMLHWEEEYESEAA